MMSILANPAAATGAAAGLGPWGWAAALFLIPGFLDSMLGLIGRGSTGRQERASKAMSENQFLTNALLVSADRQKEQESRAERSRVRQSASVDQTAARESLMNLLSTQLEMARMGESQRFSEGLNMAAMLGGMPGVSQAVSPNPALQAEAAIGNPLIDYGIL